MKRTLLRFIALMSVLTGTVNPMGAQTVEELIEAAMAVDLSQVSFSNTVYTVDGIRYKLDETNKLARCCYFNRDNVAPEKFVIPQTITVSEQTYVVVSVEGNYSYMQSNTNGVVLPSTSREMTDYALYPFNTVKTFQIPENVEKIGKNLIGRDNVTVRFKGLTPPVFAGAPYSSNNKLKFYVPAASFRAYHLADYIENCCVIADVPDTGTVVTGRVSNGELGYVVVSDIQPEIRTYADVNRLIISSGTIDEQDWYAMRNMHNLVYLDLSGLSISEMPYGALEGCWQIETVILPPTLKAIRGHAFYNTGVSDLILPDSLREISGSYNFYNCDSLRSIVIPDSVKSLPSYCFSNSNNLEAVQLPCKLSSMGSYCFQSCNLLSLSVPGTLYAIPYSAFSSNSNLVQVELNNGIGQIDSYAFSSCSSLPQITFPSSMRRISTAAFQYDYALASVSFNEGLEEIDDAAFYNCSSLTHIVLPSSLQFCLGSPFQSCNNITRIDSYALIPPTVRANLPTYNARNIELYVPLWSYQEYMTTPGWLEYQDHTKINYDILPENIVINKEFEFLLDEKNNVQGYTPNIRLLYNSESIDDGFGHTKYERGNLTVSSWSKLAVGDFSMYVSPYAKYYADMSYFYNKCEYDYNRTVNNPNSLIVKGEMRAENQTLNMMLYNDRWQFVSFPFQVKVSDIVPEDSKTQWVIRSYSGAERAAKHFDNTWQNLGPDDYLEPGKGYIMMCYNTNAPNNLVSFTVTPVVESTSRQYLFTSDDRVIELEENLSDYEQDRSWNLIGNPYPCYFDTRYLDTESPFMVWNSYSRKYEALSPVDDSYILNPGEAFFIQRPIDSESLTFLRGGRQTHRNPNNLTVQDAPMRGTVERRVYNITVKTDSLTDRTRVVINPKAVMGYELSRDAARFRSENMDMPGIWSVSDGIEYAINERPEENGEVSLSLYLPKTGYHTIGIGAGSYSGPVVIVDRKEGNRSVITADQGYTFYSESGSVNDRFVIILESGKDATGIERIISGGDGADVYNISGQKADGTENGILIREGKKLLNK